MGARRCQRPRWRATDGGFHALARPHSRLHAAHLRGRRLRHRPPRHRVHLRALARAARNRRDRAGRRRQRHRTASPVSPLGRTHAEGVPAGADARPRPAAAARFGERARRLVRGRAFGPGPAARSVRHARGDVARRMENRRRRLDGLLRLSPLAVRHRAGDGDRPRARRARLRGSRARRRRRSPTCAAAGRKHRTSRTAPAPRRSRSASSTTSNGVPTGRCGSC